MFSCGYFKQFVKVCSKSTTVLIWKKGRYLKLMYICIVHTYKVGGFYGGYVVNGYYITDNINICVCGWRGKLRTRPHDTLQYYVSMHILDFKGACIRKHTDYIQIYTRKCDRVCVYSIETECTHEYIEWS